MERQLPLCTASTPARDTRLDDAQDGYGSPRTMHAAGIALRHAVGRPPTAPRHASRGFKEFLFLVVCSRVSARGRGSRSRVFISSEEGR